MRLFLHLPQSDEEHRNTRINLEHVISYYYDLEKSAIVFEMYNQKEICLYLHNIKAQKLMKKIDSLTKPLRLKISKTDVK